MVDSFTFLFPGCIVNRIIVMASNTIAFCASLLVDWLIVMTNWARRQSHNQWTKRRGEWEREEEVKNGIVIEGDMAIQLRGVVNAYLDANHNQLTLCDAVTNVDVIFWNQRIHVQEIFQWPPLKLEFLIMFVVLLIDGRAAISCTITYKLCVQDSLYRDNFKCVTVYTFFFILLLRYGVTMGH